MKFIFVGIALILHITSAVYGQIVTEEEVAADLVVVQRTVAVNLADCLNIWDGLRCMVGQLQQGTLLGVEFGIGRRSFEYRVGNFERIQVVFSPNAAGYKIEVFAGSVSGPYTNYIRRAFRSLPANFQLRGIKIKPL